MPDVSIEVLVNEPLATIHPNIYGHFMEHLGGCVEEGCWVGEESRITHTGGIRNDVVTALKAIGAPVIRWPGGCFADDYHWQDGIGPRAERPRRINIHWGDVIETNAFGTHEFIDFCRSVGAAPYFCGNLGSGTPQEMRDWVEYCNYPGDSTLARQRAENGAAEPFQVRYWGVGNENWGCGGHFTPEDYGTEYRRFATYLRNWGGQPLTLIACGPNGNDLDWTRRFFTKLKKDYGRGPAIHSYAAHYYCGTAGTATEYTESQWYELLWKAVQMEPLVVQQRALMDAFDPERKIGLIVDEWGTWHPPTPGHNPAFLWQQNTVRDALVAALTLDIFNRHADKVVMSNIAQTINVLQALILTEGDKMLTTPTYHVYDLYEPHQGGETLRILFDTPDTEVVVGGITRKLPVLSGSASRRGRQLTMTVVNTSATETIEASIRLCGGAQPTQRKIDWLQYPEGDLHAHNTFEAGAQVTLGGESEPLQTEKRESIYAFPPASVSRLTYTLG
jgi:alpha-N-arabinofuranosidase